MAKNSNKISEITSQITGLEDKTIINDYNEKSAGSAQETQRAPRAPSAPTGASAMTTKSEKYKNVLCKYGMSCRFMACNFKHDDDDNYYN